MTGVSGGGDRLPREGNAMKRKPKHHCPDWCHRCPDLVAIVKDRRQRLNEPGPVDTDEYVMPGCMGGVYYGLGGCHCDTGPTQRETYKVTVELSATTFDRLNESVGYPYSSQRLQERAGTLLTEALRPKRGNLKEVRA